MNKITAQLIANLELGGVQQYENLTVIPLFYAEKEGPQYLTLQHAIAAGVFKVTEISTSGSVPELRVVNKGETPVLLLDGEELVGARQNRILNTTILIAGNTETLIPVSCCEQGRWHYSSPDFKPSSQIMAAELRQRKMKYVRDSLATQGHFHPDQGSVWRDIKELSNKVNVNSPTGAMKDIFESRDKDLRRYVEAIPSVSGQKGLMVFLNGNLLGCDYVSSESAYHVLHEKLLRSYTVDSEGTPSVGEPSRKRARAFLDSVLASHESSFQSIGLGTDFRYEGNRIIGSALFFQDSIVHAAFFPSNPSDVTDGMASYQHRSRHYRNFDDTSMS